MPPPRKQRAVSPIFWVDPQKWHQSPVTLASRDGPLALWLWPWLTSGDDLVTLTSPVCLIRGLLPSIRCLPRSARAGTRTRLHACAESNISTNQRQSQKLIFTMWKDSLQVHVFWNDHFHILLHPNLSIFPRLSLDWLVLSFMYSVDMIQNYLIRVSPCPAKSIYLNFHPQVGDKFSYMFNLIPSNWKFWCFNAHFILKTINFNGKKSAN